MPIIATIILAVIYLVIVQRILDRLHLTDIQALAVVAALIIGTLIDVPLTARVSINLGGSTAIALAIYVIFRADTNIEQARAVVAAVVTAGLLYLYPVVIKVPEPGLDLMYWHGPAAGAIAYVLGRSRRAAFSGGVLSVLILDLANLITGIRQGPTPTTVIAGGGVVDALVIAGITAAVLAELVGETLERLLRSTGGNNN